jgi:hypothetical protein
MNLYYGRLRSIKQKRGKELDMTNKCRGLGDWFGCLRCEHICTERCPIERDDVIETLSHQMKLIEQERKALINIK